MLHKKHIINFLLFIFKLPHSAQQVMDDDDEKIVDESEIDTNANNLDNYSNDVVTGIARTYSPIQLKKWRPAPVVGENYGRPGELGNLEFMRFLSLNN